MNDHLVANGFRLLDVFHDLMVNCGVVFALGYGEEQTDFSDAMELYLGRMSYETFLKEKSGFVFAAGLGKYNMFDAEGPGVYTFPTMKIYASHMFCG